LAARASQWTRSRNRYLLRKRFPEKRAADLTLPVTVLLTSPSQPCILASRRSTSRFIVRDPK
jgi:hypothetical protein